MISTNHFLYKSVKQPADNSKSSGKVNILDLTEEAIFQNDPVDIVEHSKRHAIITEVIARKMGLPDNQIEILKRASWAHDIGGALKHLLVDEQKFLLSLEFTESEKFSFGTKPSFNYKLCIEHAKKRIDVGLRENLTDEEILAPFSLYLEEFELLKGAPLTTNELELLKTWWCHPQYSVDVLISRGIFVTPEVEILIRCNEQPWLFDYDESVRQCIDKSVLTRPEIKNLVAIMRVADIVENGNNQQRRELRGVEIEDFASTLAFLKHKFSIDDLDDCMGVIAVLEELKKEGNEQLIDVILRSRGHYCELENDYKHAILENVVHESVSLIEGRGNRITEYKYSTTNEYSIMYENLWYKFSFVPERRGDFDKLLLLEEALPEAVNELKVPHLSPENRHCPFCCVNIDEVICKLKLPSGSIYSFLINIAPYGEDHFVMAGGAEQPQVLSQGYVDDLLVASYALGKNYEGSFTSFSGSSVKHSHGQFYRVKTPVWRNLLENRLYIVNMHKVDDVVCGELANWPARTIIFKGKDRNSVAQQVWQAIYKLMCDGVPYNTKFMYCEDGNYIWLLAPRLHGFMTFAKYFLADENTPESIHVSGCGSIESPGGDAIMFFDVPKNLTQNQQELMTKRFAKTLRMTSNWASKPYSCKPNLLRCLDEKSLNKCTIAHRIENLVQAQKAMYLGFDMLEVDVQLTADDQIVALWGSVNSANQTLYSYRLDYKELCKKLGAQILKIDELYRHVNGKLFFNFDIKDWSDGLPGYKQALIKALIALVKSHNAQNNILFESFNLDYVLSLQAAGREQGIDFITGFSVHQHSDESVVMTTILAAIEHGVDTIFLYPDMITEKVVATINQTNLILLTMQSELHNTVLDRLECAIIDVRGK